jgi:hypothetical protein
MVKMSLSPSIRSGGIAPFILYLGSRRWGVSFTRRLPCARRNAPVPLDSLCATAGLGAGNCRDLNYGRPVRSLVTLLTEIPPGKYGMWLNSIRSRALSLFHANSLLIKNKNVYTDAWNIRKSWRMMTGYLRVVKPTVYTFLWTFKRCLSQIHFDIFYAFCTQQHKRRTFYRLDMSARPSVCPYELVPIVGQQ